MFIGKYNRFCFTVSLGVYQLESVQYRSIIRFLYLNGKSRDEILVELNDVYGEQSPSLPTIKRWFNEFKAGITFAVDIEKS